MNIDNAGTLRRIDYKQRYGGAGRHERRFGDELLGERFASAQSAQMVKHTPDYRSVHADRRGFAGFERELDLLEERQPCDGRVFGEGVFRERVDVFHRAFGLPAKHLQCFLTA